MSKLTKLCGKLKETVELGEGEDKITVELKAPNVEDLSEIAALFSNKDKTDGISPEQLTKITRVLMKMLKESEPDATDEELSEVIVANLGVLISSLTKLLEKAFNIKDKKN